MGMFDSFYDNAGNEWQTKAYVCDLERFVVSGPVPLVHPYDLPTYQVEVLGGPNRNPSQDGFATIRDGYVESVPAERDNTLPLLDYSGHLIDNDEEKSTPWT